MCLRTWRKGANTYNSICCSMPSQPFLSLSLYESHAVYLLFLLWFCASTFILEIGINNNKNNSKSKIKMRYYISIVDRTNKKNYYRNESVVVVEKNRTFMNKQNKFMRIYRRASIKRNRLLSFSRIPMIIRLFSHE